MALTDKLTAIADAIREKTGTSDTMTLDEMAENISSIEEGSGETTTVTKYGATIDCFLGDVDEDGVLQYPTGSGDLVFTGVNTISNSYALTFMFYQNTSLTSVDLSSLTSVSGYECMFGTFYGCTGLTGELNLSNITQISGTGEAMRWSFRNCTGLTSVDLSSLTTVSGSQYSLQYAFSACTGLTSVDLSSLTTVSGMYDMSGAFKNCTSLTSVDLSSLTTLSGVQCMTYIFNGCTSLTSVDLSNLQTISNSGLEYAFQDCGVTSLYLPALTSLGRLAFGYCTSLTKIWLPSTCTTISASSYSYSPFYSCSSTLEIYTDVEDEDSIPEGWGTYWNYYGSGKTLTVHYGAAHDEYEAA